MNTADQSAAILAGALLAQLPAYGLNPRDWWVPQILSPAKSLASVELRHREDDDFRIIASLQPSQNGEIRFHQLTLATWMET